MRKSESVRRRLAQFRHRITQFGRRWLALPAEPAPTTEVFGRTPAGTRFYVVGDIHGRLDLLDAVLARIGADRAARPVAVTQTIFLGDYFDRGPATAGVVDRLIALRRNEGAVCLKGNHEAMVLDVLSGREPFGRWRRMGGMEALLSYGVRTSVRDTSKQDAAIRRAFGKALPAEHLAFLQTLATSHASGGYFFVHAGVRPGVPLDRQVEDDLVWIRKPFLSRRTLFEKLIVHGHTPVAEPEVRPNRINIDTGAYATGRLTCLVLENDDRRFL